MAPLEEFEPAHVKRVLITGKQQRFGQACASVQSRQRFRCLHTQYMELEEASTKEAEIWPNWTAVQALSKDHKLHNTKIPFLML